jgi:hypothetical protein
MMAHRSGAPPGLWPALVVVFVLLLATVGVTLAPAQEAMTVEQKAAAFDALVAADPAVSVEPTLALLTGRDLVLSGGAVTVDVAPWLHYDIAVDVRTVKDFAPPPDWRGYVGMGALGITIGAAAVVLLNLLL